MLVSVPTRSYTCHRFESLDRYNRKSITVFRLTGKIRLIFTSLLFIVLIGGVGTSGLLNRSVYAQTGGEDPSQQPEDAGQNVCDPEEQVMNVCGPEEGRQVSPGEEQSCTGEEQVCTGNLPPGGSYETPSGPPSQMQTEISCNPDTNKGCKHWYDYPTYEKLFAKKAGKEYNPCELEEFKQAAEVGEKVGKVGAVIVECVAGEGLGCAAEIGTKATDTKFPTPPALIIEGGSAAVGAALNGAMCAGHKISEGVKSLLGPSDEEIVKRNLGTLNKATQKWCMQYDNQQGQACLKLMQAYDKCLVSPHNIVNKHGKVNKPLLNMYFVNGAIANGQNPCFWEE
jgi:hypothetical protein